MIKVTRINGKELVVNAELIEFLEQTPDVIISLTTGKKFAVMDSINEIVEKIIRYRVMIGNQGPLLGREGETQKSLIPPRQLS